MKSDFLLAIGQLAAEKNLPRDVVIEAIENALSAAYRRDGEESPSVYVKVDAESGDIRAYTQKTVVADVEDEQVELSLDQARRYKRDASEGDVLDFEVKLPENAGRIAAQTAKQVVLQRLREAERDAVFEEYADKVGELVVGTVQRIEARQVIVELGRGTEAVLPIQEQVRNEHLRPGQRVKIVILDVQRAVKGPPIIVSRSHRLLLRRLFEVEVPEIRSGTVEIKSIAREGGHRSKVAVHARVPSIDAIGACVGMRGARIQNIVNELGGERVDIIRWDPKPSEFIMNALSPAQALDVEADAMQHRALVTVPDTMMSLAIGREGQNARLAAKLTGWNVDIQTQSASEARAAGEEVRVSAFAPAAPGEEADIDLVAEFVEPEPAPVLETMRAVASPVQDRAASIEGLESRPADEDIVFAAAIASMPIPDREAREAEDYGEEDEGEEYEIPAMVVPEERPSAIRFAEDVMPQTDDEAAEAARRAAARRPARRAPRILDEVEEDMEDIDYSGRIH